MPDMKTYTIDGKTYNIRDSRGDVFLDHSSTYATWVNVPAGSTVGDKVVLADINIQPGRWLFLIQNGNGLGSAVNCNIETHVIGSSALLIGGSGISNDTSGNRAIAYAYIRADVATTIRIQTHTYNTSVENFNGSVAIIPVL